MSVKERSIFEDAPLDFWVKWGGFMLLACACILMPATVQGVFSRLWDNSPLGLWQKIGGSEGGTIAAASVSGSAVVAIDPGSYGDITLDKDQASNAAAIIKEGKKRNLGDRDIQAALMAALQESTMKNLDHGDDWWFGGGAGSSDSLGLFQQRDSWGSKECRTAPDCAAGLFYDALVKISDRDSLTLAAAIQKVQVSAFPDEYAKWEQTAAAILKAAKVEVKPGVTGDELEPLGKLKFQFEFSDEVTEDEKAIVQKAADFWGAIITTDHTITLKVTAQQTSERWLASAIPTVTGSDGLAIEGNVRINPAEMDKYKNDEKYFQAVVVHEMGHVLGIGAGWQNGLVDKSNWTYTGTAADGVYGGPVPVEPKVAGHWDEDKLSKGYDGGELMTPVAEQRLDQMYLGEITIAALRDQGWETIEPVHIPMTSLKWYQFLPGLQPRH